MQKRQQRSLISFFPNSPPATIAKHKEPLVDQEHGKVQVQGVSHAQMMQRQDEFQRNFDSLKSKLFRPSKSIILSKENSPSVDTAHESLEKTGSDFTFEAPTSGAGAGKGVERNFDIEPPIAVECWPSIPGIKRVREDHDGMLQNQALGANLLKRKKLLEALGEGQEQHGLWEEAKAKFEWLSSSNIRDGKGRRPGDPLYDKRTLQIPANVLNKMSASQKQYWMTKCQYMDTVLFFKVGKFYELYEIDAEIGHKELNWKMTVSGVGKCRQVGVPESGIEDAVSKLLARGYKVGRMEQVETAEQAKARRGPGAMVQRKLTHVSAPSTAMDDDMKPEAVHLLALREELDYNHIAENTGEKTIFGFAFVDAAAGRFFVGSLRDDESRSALGALLTQVAPKELLYELGGLSHETMQVLRRYSSHGFLPLEFTPLMPNVEFLEAAAAIDMIQSNGYFRESPCLEGHVLSAREDRWLEVLKTVNDFKPAAISLGALASHLHRMKLDGMLLEKGLLFSYEVFKGSLRLDGQTLSNLEIFQNNADGGKAGTLLSFLDNCLTPFGKRLLRRWMCHPLQDIRDINDRLDVIDEFRSRPGLVGTLRAGLRQLPDLERLVSRLRSLSGSAGVASIPLIQNKFQRTKVLSFNAAVKGLLSGFELLKSLRHEDEQGPICSRILLAASDLEGLHEAYTLLVLMSSEIDTKFSTLKKEALKQGKVLDDNDMGLLSQLLTEFNKQNGSWLTIIESLSKTDVLISFAVSIDGTSGPTCRPEFVSKMDNTKGGAVLKITELWHPFATGGQCGMFVRNDVTLGWKTSPARAMLLTGPNMGGKSTLLRATCLAIILAQMGCHVPAESCILSIVDIIFTRLGASDHIMSGESTFMVECAEASSVLRHATGDSLVILDELGRGTSTFDGYAIAYAVFRHLVDTIDCRLLFATHYHPLTTEFAAHPSVTLQHMSCTFQDIQSCRNPGRSDSSKDSESEKRLVFRYKMCSGASPDSYGLHVASLAGIPRTVIDQAEEARSVIKARLSSSFSSNAHREHFSHAHEEWMRTIIALQNVNISNSESLDIEDAYDTLYCIWHELQKGVRKGYD